MIKCALDEDGCIDLLAILRIMNHIRQEQAWALAYELARLMQRMWPAGNNCAIIESLAQIYIHHEGYIHEKSLWSRINPLLDQQSLASHATGSSDEADIINEDAEHQTLQNNLSKQRNSNVSQHSNNKTTETTTKLPPTPPITPELSDEILRRRTASSEAELIASLGMALFWALDYEIPDDEERKLSIAMEYLIVQSQKEMNLSELEQICIKRLPVAKKKQADLHYRQVCKSLVQETIEVSYLLDKIYTATMALSGASDHHQFHLHQQLQAAISGADATSGGNQEKQTKLAASGQDYLRIAQQLASGERTNLGSKTSTKQQQQQVAMTDLDDEGQMKGANCRSNVITFRDHFVDDDELSDLRLPLASLRALKINDWARLWMQVIRELRQRGKTIIAT